MLLLKFNLSIQAQGRYFPSEKIVLGSKTIVSNEQADWGREATREKVISAVSKMFLCFVEISRF